MKTLSNHLRQTAMRAGKRGVAIFWLFIVLIYVRSTDPAPDLTNSESAAGQESTTPAAPSSEPANLIQVNTGFTTHTYENPPGGCLPSNHDLVLVSPTPNMGNLWPDSIVSHETPVQVLGLAEHQERAADCSVSITHPTFTWALTYENPDGETLDVTESLVNKNTLTPSFTATYTGTYQVDLMTSDPDTIVLSRIQVLDSGIRWVSIGPNGTTYLTSGRVNAIAFDPRISQDGTIYIGTAAGGVWKSTDNGASWRPMMDNKGMPTMAIGALAVGTDGTIYAGTGDPNALDSRPGQGIYKSTDGGRTWSPAGGPAIGSTIYRILIDPAGLVYSASEAGVFRSNNSGSTWTPIRNNLTGNVFDIVLNPNDPNHLYALTSDGTYSTRNPGGNPNWTRLGGTPCASPTRARGGLAVSPGSSQVVWAGFVCDNDVIVYRSADQGANWTQIEPLPWTDQSWYNFSILADRDDPDILYLGNVALWRYDFNNYLPAIYCGSNDPGPCWTDWSGPGSRTPNARGANMHGDVHALAYEPVRPWLYAATDGGVYRYDVYNPAVRSWQAVSYNLAIGQFRTLGFNPNWPGDVAGGLQDNATLRREIWGLRYWNQVPNSSGDGWWANYDAQVPTIMGIPWPWATWLSTIYFNPQAGLDDPNTPDNDADRIDRTGSSAAPATTLGLITAHWTDPLRPGTMVAISPPSNRTPPGQLYYTNNAHTAPSAIAVNWTCIDPTANNSSDQVVEVGGSRSNLNGFGSYYVGLDNGQIWFVEVSSPSTGFTRCSLGAALSQNQLIYNNTSLNPTPIIGLVEDPNRTCVLYALAPGANDLRFRIVQVIGTLSSGRCTSPWSFNGIAGQPADAPGSPTPGAFPATLNGQPITIQSRAIAVDPSIANLLYVGTNAGLFMSQFDGTTWNWTRARDVPETPITDIKAQINSGGSFGLVYAATYGRGVYERVIVNPTAITALDVRRNQTTTNVIQRCQVREHEGPGAHWRVVNVEVDYRYNGDQGSNVWIRPVVTNNLEPSPYFIREIAPVSTGTGTVNLQVIYGSADAPLGITTDGLRVEMFPEGGHSFLSGECHFKKTWRLDNARLVEVRAEDIIHEGGHREVIVPIKVSLSDGTIEEHNTPFIVVVPQGVSITLEAPTIHTHGDEVRGVRQWLLQGLGEASTLPSFSFHVSGDTTVLVRYHELERIFLPFTLR